MSLYDQHLSNVANGALAKLGTATVDMKTAAATVIFAAAKKCIISHVVVHSPTASLAGGTSYAFGTGFRNNEVVSLATLTTAATDFIALPNVAAAGTSVKGTALAAGANFSITVATGSTAVASATVDVFGYYA